MASSNQGEQSLGNSDNKNALELIVNGMERFSYNLLNVIYDQDKNQIISPYSISTALFMAYAGAKGDTADEILDILNIPMLSEHDIHETNKVIVSELLTMAQDITFINVNSMWLKKRGNIFSEKFKAILESQYGADAFELTTAEKINNWVSEKTAGKIVDLVENVDPNTILIIVNAVYFLGKWSEPFDPELIFDSFFKTIKGEEVQTPFMTKRGLMYYEDSADYELIKLPYSKERVYMEILLPKGKLNTHKLVKSLLNERIDWSRSLTKMYGTLSLPKFSISYEATLNQELEKLGMKKAFDVETADFSKMIEVPPNVFIDEIKHKGFISVDETGVETGAATSVQMVRGSYRQNEFNLLLNRPFLFRLRDEVTGIPLFLGHVADPSQ